MQICVNELDGDSFVAVVGGKKISFVVVVAVVVVVVVVVVLLLPLNLGFIPCQP